MEAAVKATVTIDNKVVTFEGPADFVDAQVAKYISYSHKSDNAAHNEEDERSLELKANAGSNEKRLVLEKKPKGHSETVAVLAFAFAESGKSEFTEEDIRRAYIRAGVKPPKAVGQAIRDAKNYFDYVGYGSKRGTYKLSNHGDRTVRFDLPRPAEGKE